MLRSKDDNPCWKCEKRSTYCHVNCEEYSKYLAKLKVENEAIRKAKAKTMEADTFLVGQSERVRKKQQAAWQKKYADQYKKGD